MEHLMAIMRDGVISNIRNISGDRMRKRETVVIVDNTKFYVKEKKAYDVVKRIFDVIAAFVFLVLFFWIFIAVAIAIKLDDGGPVMYVSNRVGKFGREFKFYKFRSMRIDADEVFKDIEELNESDGELFKIKNDPRITRVGRFIRKTSLDELPQIFNILKGDMSFVGPRPPLPREVKDYDDEAMQRLSVIGGLTCYWQIGGRSKIDFKGMVELDRKYIQERGILTDLKILLKTIPAVLKGDGAY